MDTSTYYFTWMDTSLSTESLYVSILVSIGAYCSVVAIYRLFFSPLRSIPGPWYAAISEIWLITHVLRFRRCRAINELLQKYGHIVRVAPNKVIFLDTTAMKSVYGVGSKLNKSAFYKCFMTYENDQALVFPILLACHDWIETHAVMFPSSMSILEHEAHAIRKRGYAPHYNQSNLATYQPEVHDRVLRMIQLVSQAVSQRNAALDILLLFRHLLIDISCIHLFEYESSFLEAWSKQILQNGQSDILSDAISDFPKRGLIRSALPSWLWNAFQYLPIRRWNKLCDSDAVVGEFITMRLVEAKARLKSNNDHANETRIPLIIRLLQYKCRENELMPDKDIVSECFGHLVAGTETTSTTLSYILWELTRRRDVMMQLQAEMDRCIPDPLRIPDIKVLQDQVYLSAVLKEGLRIYTAGPAPLERIAPKVDGGYTLLGHTIPQGTVIASQSWSSHRRPDVFFSPELFLPDRWLLNYPPFLNNGNFSVKGHRSSSAHIISATDSSTPSLCDAEQKTHSDTFASEAQMNAHMFPFGHGSRVCGGQNMAQIVLRIVLAIIVRNFDILAPPETNTDSMAIKDSFAIFPAAMECKLVFIPRSH